MNISNPLAHLILQEEVLSGWRIQRIIDGSERADFTIPRDFSIKPGQKVKVSVLTMI